MKWFLILLVLLINCSNPVSNSINEPIKEPINLTPNWLSDYVVSEFLIGTWKLESSKSTFLNDNLIVNDLGFDNVITFTESGMFYDEASIFRFTGSGSWTLTGRELTLVYNKDQATVRGGTIVWLIDFNDDYLLFDRSYDRFVSSGGYCCEHSTLRYVNEHIEWSLN